MVENNNSPKATDSKWEDFVAVESDDVSQLEDSEEREVLLCSKLRILPARILLSASDCASHLEVVVRWTRATGDEDRRYRMTRRYARDLRSAGASNPRIVLQHAGLDWSHGEDAPESSLTYLGSKNDGVIFWHEYRNDSGRYLGLHWETLRDGNRRHVWVQISSPNQVVRCPIDPFVDPTLPGEVRFIHIKFEAE